MHAATRALEIHYVELLVQECVELIRPSLHPGGGALKHLLVHVFNCVLIICYFEKLSQLFMSLLLWVKVHLS